MILLEEVQYLVDNQSLSIDSYISSTPITIYIMTITGSMHDLIQTPKRCSSQIRSSPSSVNFLHGISNHSTHTYLQPLPTKNTSSILKVGSCPRRNVHPEHCESTPIYASTLPVKIQVHDPYRSNYTTSNILCVKPSGHSHNKLNENLPSPNTHFFFAAKHRIHSYHSIDPTHSSQVLKQ